jgi:N-acetylmuramoyl-L-alanine amidase
MLGSISPKNPKTYYVYIAAFSMSIIMLLTAIGYAVYWPRFGNTDDLQMASDYVLAPDLAGYDLTKAKEIVKEDGLSLKIDHWVGSKIHVTNSVVSQHPQPYSSIKTGETITVTVSSGSKEGSSTKGPEQVNIVDNLKPLPSPVIQPAKIKTTKIVVIDPGHQQKSNLSKEPIAPGSSTMKAKTSSGTRGKKTGTPEYKVTLQIAERLKTALEERKVKVIMTREIDNVDISNVERAEIGNEAKADLVVRIHADGSTDANKSGISTLYPADNKWTGSIYNESFKAAKIVQESIVSSTGHNDNGVVARDDLTGFNWSKVPVILVETGFLTNSREEADLLNDSYQDKLAKAIAEGILEHMK